MNNRQQYLSHTIEGSSTGGDHFRHVYGFVEALFLAMETKIVDYDKRERIIIDNENFDKYKLQFDKMIESLSGSDYEINLKASQTYPKLDVRTSLQRELYALLDHERRHLGYMGDTDEDMVGDISSFTPKIKTDFLLTDTQSIISDLHIDFFRYEKIASKIELPLSISRDVDKIYRTFHVLQKQFDTDDMILLNNIYTTSVSNEYYKLEEEMMHILYAIRLYIRDNNKEDFQKLLQEDPQFGIARSTTQALSTIS